LPGTGNGDSFGTPDPLPPGDITRMSKPPARQTKPVSAGVAEVPLMMAANAHRAGNLAEAERFFRMALQTAPAHAPALAMLGVVLAQQGRAGEGVPFLAQAVKHAPDYGNWFNYGLVLRAAGHADEAARAFVKASKLHRTEPQAAWEAGVTLRGLERLDEAAAAFDIVCQRDPDSPTPWIEAGRAHLAAGQAGPGLDRLRQALRRFESDDDVCRAVCLALESVTFRRHDPAFQAALGRWAAMPDDKPVWFGGSLLGLLRLDPALTPLLAMVRDGGGFADAAVTDGTLQPLFACLPLRNLMASDVLADPDFEILMVALRRTLTRCVAGGQALAADAHAVLMGLALLADAGEFAMPEDDAVVGLAVALAEGLAADIDAGAVTERFAERLAVVGCHRPLARLPVAARLAALAPTTQDPLLARLLTVAVVDPLRERQLRGQVIQVTAIDDAVSLAVAGQYDENPYPRWFNPPAENPIRSDEWLRATFPHAAFTPHALRPHRILVAGCGSGWQAFCTARLYPDAEILAVDLSLTNLAHALRAQEKFGFTNVTFRRADIMRLGELGESFDVIQSNGVLHHMGDPLAGWAALNGVLKPGGLMRIGLYSEVARRTLRVIEDFARQHGFGGDAAGLRGFRAAALALPEDHPVRLVVRSKEFYALSSLRDLAFHVNEHRFTIPSLAAALARLDLAFIGFQLHHRLSATLYHRRYPDDPAQTDLGHWAEFEDANPHTFAGCYDFWCAKPER